MNRRATQANLVDVRYAGDESACAIEWRREAANSLVPIGPHAPNLTADLVSLRSTGEHLAPASIDTGAVVRPREVEAPLTNERHGD